MTLMFLLVHSFPSKWKVAASTLQLSPVSVAERQPRAPPFQLGLDSRFVTKSSVVSTERRLSSSVDRSQGSAKAALLMSVRRGIIKKGRN